MNDIKIIRAIGAVAFLTGFGFGIIVNQIINERD